jgi:hypothetical protein
LTSITKIIIYRRFSFGESATGYFATKCAAHKAARTTALLDKPTVTDVVNYTAVLKISAGRADAFYIPRVLKPALTAVPISAGVPNVHKSIEVSTDLAGPL